MSDPVVSSPTPGTAAHSRRGQSLVEFALVLPMLLVLLLGIADFGRVFAAGIVLEASARNAAEAAAQEYLQLARNAPTIDPADYQRVHDVAAEEVCREATHLDESDVDADGVCDMPHVAICIHDVPADPDDLTPPPGDPGCGDEAPAAPPECWTMGDTWNNTKTDGADALAYVEVRVCYRFETLFNLSELRLPLGWGLSLGEVWLQRDRSFVVADY